VIDVVLAMLDAGGYDAVQMKEVASQAQVSLATLYAEFGPREELIVTALELWMTDHIWVNFDVPVSTPTSVYDGLMTIMRAVFEPWESHPRILAAFHRARSSEPGRARLQLFGLPQTSPMVDAMTTNLEPDFVADGGLILYNVMYALVARCAEGDIEVTEILPMLERTVYRLMEHRPELS